MTEDVLVRTLPSTLLVLITRGASALTVSDSSARTFKVSLSPGKSGYHVGGWEATYEQAYVSYGSVLIRPDCVFMWTCCVDVFAVCKILQRQILALTTGIKILQIEERPCSRDYIRVYVTADDYI